MCPSSPNNMKLGWRQVGARLLLDCCQAVPNLPVDVQTMGADWIVASAHKMCGPTGIGFLWGRFATFHLSASILLVLSAVGPNSAWVNVKQLKC